MPATAYKSPINCDVLIIGAGVMGLATGIALLESKPNLKVIIAEKEDSLAKHASGRPAYSTQVSTTHPIH